MLVFSHHTLRTTRFPSTDPTRAADPLRRAPRPHDEPPQPVRPDAPPETTLEDLFCRHDNVLAHVERPRARELRARRTAARTRARAQNPFVEVSTAAHIDWPQQSRTIELLDDDGRDLSLALTILDHDGPAEPGRAATPARQPVKLASIAREIAYNDYQGSRGATRRAASDRNVIVADRQALAAAP